MSVPAHHPASVQWPAPATPLLGRTGEVDALYALLAGDETRLVTVTGPGGVGKTRLALAVLDQLAQDGVSDAVFVPLDHLRDPELLPGAIGAALGVREAGQTALLDLVVYALNERLPLLVLDNLEQIATGAAMTIAYLLGRSPGVTVLTTSRVPLSIRGERRFPLDPLPLPRAGPAAHTESPALALFVDRAQAVRPDFALTDANRETVTEICRRLDGLPLAIELAAARSRVLSPEALLARLTNRLTVVGGGLADLPERQQTLRSTIAWSYDLLTGNLRRGFRALAAIPSESTLELAAAVTGLDADATLSVVEVLVDQSLLTLHEEAGLPVRFGMLQTIREFGLEQTVAHGELESARRALAEHYLNRSDEIRTGLKGAEAPAWHAWCQRERINLSAAIDWLAENRDAPGVVSLTGALWTFWYNRGHYREGIDALERALANADRVPAGLRASAYHGLGTLHFGLDDHPAATEALDLGAGLAEQANDQLRLASIVNVRALLARRLGDYPAAIAGFERIIAMFRELGDPRHVALVEDNLGLVYSAMGQHARAVDLHARSVASARDSGDNSALAHALHHLANALYALDDLPAATARAEEARVILQRLEERSQLAHCLNTLGVLAKERGDLDEAAARYGEALGLWRALEQRRGISITLINLSTLALERGDLTTAAAHLREGFTRHQAENNPRVFAYSVRGFAELALALGDPGRAARLTAFTKALAARHGFHFESDDARQRARRSLGKARFDAEWKAGMSMSRDSLLAEIELITVPETAFGDQILSAVPPRRNASNASHDDHGLTARELDVLRQVAAGKTNAEIGGALFISPFTAKTHVANLLGKLGVESRAAASTWAAQHGLL